MSTINFANREINFKIVYYGPGLSGKTTNLRWIYQTVPEGRKGEMVSLATEDERTLFFDFLPVDLGEVKGFKTRFHLYTVPGQVFYNASRKLILRGVDGIVFVADSASNRLPSIISSSMPRASRYVSASIVSLAATNSRSTRSPSSSIS